MLTVGPDILGEVKEKNMTHTFAPPPSALTCKGFPEPFARDEAVCFFYWCTTILAQLHRYICNYCPSQY
jgi:hypothetical protein